MATLTATVTQQVTRTVAASASVASASSTNRVVPQGGVFEGLNPTRYNTKDPIVLFIIQAALVIAFTRILHWPLSKLRQPRVIAEVITGILLGPSVMGRIPGFTQHIFPTASMPAFSLAANIGLVLFLFLVGLEVDLRFLISNWRIALSVGAAGMALPFGLGVAIAWGLYNDFHNEPDLVPIGFGTFALFIGVALSITAFPVLCRILTSLKLLSTPVGVIVLSAGVGNDVVGWILLALCVTLVNSGAGLTALWIFLVSVGYSLVLAYLVRPVFIWTLRRTRSLENGPTQGVVALTLLLVLASAFLTNIIGIHAIFGAFMVGLICPHEGGFAIKLTEKIEDLISTLFLPLYFALSGLSTNLGLLDNGLTWGYVVGVTAIAFVGKIVGGTIASRLNGLIWRESATIGCLMSCKGLVELIVLNIGLQARILSVRTFTIFVVMALVTTFATTPLVMWLYPPWYQEKLEAWKKGKINWDGTPRTDTSYDSEVEIDTDIASRLMVYLRTDGLSSLFNIISLFTGGRHEPQMSRRTSTSGEKGVLAVDIGLISQRPLRIHGLRLMELTERNSSVMKVSELEEYASRDPIIKAFGSLSQGATRDVTISGKIAVVPDYSFADTLVQRAGNSRSNLLLLPWSETGSVSELPGIFDHAPSGPNADVLANRDFAALVHGVYEQAANVCNVAVFVDASLLNPATSNSVGSVSPNMERPTRQLSRTVTGMSLADVYEDVGVTYKSYDGRGRPQVRVLYTGTADDLLAVTLALQFAKNGGVHVRIVSVEQSSSPKTVNNPVFTQFTELRHRMPESARTYVSFEDVNDPVATSEKVVDTLLTNKPGESGHVTVITGRGFRPAMSTDRFNPLGSTTMNVIARMRSTEVVANVLVVQSWVGQEEQRVRKDSTKSDDTK